MHLKTIATYAWASVLASSFSAIAYADEPAIVNKVNDALVRVAKMPPIVAELDNQGSLAVGNTPVQFKQYFSSEVVRWKKVVDGAGIKLAE